MATKYPTMLIRRAPRAKTAQKAPDRSARYYALLPPPPTARTVAAAWRHFEDLAAVLALAGPTMETTWTRHERANLTRLAHVWRRRAQGDDARWLLVGSQPGRLPRTVEKAIAAEPDPEWGES